MSAVWTEFATVSDSFIESRLRCERVYKQVRAQFPNMTSQFAVQHWWMCESWCCGAWSVAGSCSKGSRTVPSAFWGSCWIRRCRFAVLAPGCDMRLVGRDSQSIAGTKSYLVANWKLGRDKTKLSSHRISRLNKNCRKTKHVQFRNFLLPTVLICQFSSHRRHWQNSLVLSVSAVWTRFYCRRVVEKVLALT